MKLLLITESIPFPPRNGRELPTAKIIEQLAKWHEVDVLVLSQNDQDYKERLSKVPESIGKVWFLPYKKMNPIRRIINEVFLIKPAYFFRVFDSVQVRKLLEDQYYDFAWVNPPGNLDLLNLCKRLGFDLSRHSILGMNDLKTSLYADKMHQVKGGNFKFPYLIHWMRSFFIAKHEKKYLPRFDLIHVQTLKEKKKTVKLLGQMNYAKRVIDSPNGVKEFLYECSYDGIDQKAILFMTHLDGERKYESKWFITKVWPKIKASTEAELWLVGTPPVETINYINEDERIKVLGYVPDLKATFNSVCLSVVPIFHGTGLINRIQDSLAAGVPCVASELSASTFPDAENGKHFIAAKSVDEYAEAVINLYNDRGLKLSLSANGRQYAKEQPTWEETATRLNKHMERILYKNNQLEVIK